MPVFGDGRCLFRCIAANGFQELRLAHRNGLGLPHDTALALRETAIADCMRRNTVDFLSLHSDQLKKLCTRLPFLLDKKVGQSYQNIDHRLKNMSSPTEYTGLLELFALSYITGYNIVIYREIESQTDTFELYTEITCQPSRGVGSSRPFTITLLYDVDDSVHDGHFSRLFDPSGNARDSAAIAAVSTDSLNVSSLIKLNCQTFVDAISTRFEDTPSIPEQSPILQDEVPVNKARCQIKSDQLKSTLPSADQDSCIPSNSNNDTPDDLGCKEGVPLQPHLDKYNPKLYGVKYRDFQASWFETREWLEYSLKSNSAYCFCCRHFSSSNAKHEYAFTHTGYSNWKAALDKDKGFQKHASSSSHLQAFAVWKERQKRSNESCKISTLLNETQIERNRYYIKSVIEIIQFLVINELPLRGSTHGSSKCLQDETDEEPCGLFLKLFQYTLSKDEKLRAITKTVPQNATYTSSQFQNEVIAILAKMVRKNIVDNILNSDIKYFTLKADGTKDLTNTENISIVIRHVNNGHATEDLLTLATSEKLDARSLTNKLIEAIEKDGLTTDQILSQCYDGASVMSGKRGRVQKLMSDAAKRPIPYFHCFSHQLHLVVVHAIGENRLRQVERYFEICDALYNFLRRPTIHRLYEGGQLKRLLDQRWSGHIATTKAVLDNYECLVNVLNTASLSDECDTISSVEATGLLAKIKSESFVFIAFVVREILELLYPVDQLLQQREVDLLSALGVLSSAVTQIENLRTHEQVENILEKVKMTGVILEQDSTASVHDVPGKIPVKRKKKLPRRLADSVVEVTTGSTSRDDHEGECLTSAQKFTQIYFEIIDSCVGELRERFSERNTAIVSSVGCLWPGSKTNRNEDFLNPAKLCSLAELVQVDISSTTSASECAVAAQFIQNNFKEEQHKNLSNITELLLPVKTAFPTVYSLYAAALTLGISSASCEASFSALTRILTPYRRSMTHGRKANLVLLSFQEKYTRKIDLNHFFVEFGRSSRRLQVS